MPKIYGPYKHGIQWRLHVVSGRGDKRKTTYRTYSTIELAEAASIKAQVRESSPRLPSNGLPTPPAVEVGAYVYVMRCHGRPATFKIGFTKNLTHRLRSIKNGNPFHIELVAWWWSARASDEESDLHRQFRTSRGRGEWFAKTKQLDDFIKNKASAARDDFVDLEWPR